MEDHNNCSELIAESVDQFNTKLGELNSKWRLNVDSNKFQDNYAVYAAKKKGLAKDDYPSFSMMTNIKKANHERYSVSCYSSAFVDAASFNSMKAAA